MTLAALTILGAALWLAHSWWWPWRPCRGCHGTKKGAGSTKKTWNRCGWCSGSGEALRGGAWLLTQATRRPPRTPRRRRR